MKKTIGLIFLTLFLSSSAYAQTTESQSDLFEDMEAFRSKDKVEMKGRGYTISVKQKKKKEKYNTFSDSDAWDPMFVVVKNMFTRFTALDDTLYKVEDGDIVIFNRIGGNNYYDSIPYVRRAYVYPKNEDQYEGILFEKKGRVDTLFTRDIVEYIRHNGVPESVFVTSKDTVCFFGQKILLKRNKKDNKERQSKSYKYVAPKTLSTIEWYGYDEIRWDSYNSPTEAIQTMESDIADLKKKYGKRILADKEELVLFRGEEIMARRLSAQYSKGYKRYGVNTSYLINTEIDNKNVLLNINIKEDSVFAGHHLPSFVEKNFIKRLSDEPEQFAFFEDTIPAADTIYIPKKTRWPAWTYHSKNTKINGMSVGGFSGLQSDRNVTTNGMKFEAVGLGIFVPFAMGVGVVGMIFNFPEMVKNISSSELEFADKLHLQELKEKNNNRWDLTNGISFSVLGSFSEQAKVNGFSFGGLINGGYRINGLSVTTVASGQAYANGVHIAAGASIAGISNGLQIGGIFSYSRQVRGMQAGFINNASYEIKGLQLGCFNRSQQVHGLQIGLFNNAKILKGLQIGIWNKNKKRSLPLINWGF